jgi:hypothetical protein
LLALLSLAPALDSADATAGYLAGQRDPDGHMIIVALDLNAGREIDVCHFPPALPDLVAASAAQGSSLRLNGKDEAIRRLGI